MVSLLRFAARDMGDHAAGISGSVSEIHNYRGSELAIEREKGMSASSALSKQNITGYLTGSARSITLEVFDSVGSTNAVCLDKAACGCTAPYAAVAGSQTAGRGRCGRRFFSPDGSGLYLSILLHPKKMPAGQATQLTPMAAVAVCEAIESVCGTKCGIKWVNDIFIRGRKVCGILAEASFRQDGCLDYAVIGIGINVYVPEGGFPPELDIAGSVFGCMNPQAADSPEEDLRGRLAAEVLNSFMKYFIAYEAGMGTEIPYDGEISDYVLEYRKRCFVIGHMINVISGGNTDRAQAIGLDDKCALIVRYDDGTIEYLTGGEISIRMV